MSLELGKAWQHLRLASTLARCPMGAPSGALSVRRLCCLGWLKGWYGLSGSASGPCWSALAELLSCVMLRGIRPMPAPMRLRQNLACSSSSSTWMGICHIVRAGCKVRQGEVRQGEASWALHRPLDGLLAIETVELPLSGPSTLGQASASRLCKPPMDARLPMQVSSRASPIGLQIQEPSAD